MGQTYVSGTLQFGTIDVTEGQIVVMMVMLTSSFESFFAMNIWSSSLYFFSLNQLTTLFGALCGLYSMFKTDGTIDKIFTGGAGQRGDCCWYKCAVPCQPTPSLGDSSVG